MEQHLKDMTDQVYPYEDSKVFRMVGVPQEFYFGVLFWDDSYDPPWLCISSLFRKGMAVNSYYPTG
jgi:hypothetical protein